MVPKGRVDRNVGLVEDLVRQVSRIADVELLLLLALVPDVVWRIVASPHNEVKLLRLKVVKRGFEGMRWDVAVVVGAPFASCSCAVAWAVFLMAAEWFITVAGASLGVLEVYVKVTDVSDVEGIG